MADVQDGIAARLRRRRVVEASDPELGTVRVKRISAGEFFALMQQPAEAQKRLLVVACIVDEQDAPVYASVQDVDEQAEWVVLQRLIALVEQINLLGPKDAEKNSDSPPSPT